MIDRAQVLKKFIKDNSIIAEIGVHRCAFAKNILENIPVSEYWAIDPWRVLPVHKYQGGVKDKTQEYWDKEYERAKELARKYHPRFRLLRMLSNEANDLFQDKYFDSIFIDANHFYESVREDILLWTPKIKSGGFISGHDYSKKEWPGVKKAVDELFPDAKILGASVWIKRI